MLYNLNTDKVYSLWTKITLINITEASQMESGNYTFLTETSVWMGVVVSGSFSYETENQEKT